MYSEPNEFYLDFRLKADEIINPDLYSFPGALPDFEKFTLFASENGKRYGSFNVNEPATIALLFPALIFALRRKCRQI